uniref:hypothetical protein n=1 Tax=Pseudomonas fluorescens TaxID=294 RepID=UPI00130D7B99|nr:hypothetical protein [Pseudomonas fluorescens]
MPDFKHAVALQFATRPTLRHITGQRALHVLVARYPLIATSYPNLTSAAPLQLMRPNGRGGWDVVPFVDVLLQALFSGKALDLRDVDGLDHRLSLHPPQRFDASQSIDATQAIAQVRIVLERLNDDFNDLLALLPELFRQALVDYWRALGSAGVSRDRWLQQTLRTALLHNLGLQRLDTQQQACIRGLVAGGAQMPPVFVVEAVCERDGVRHTERLPNLLVMGEWDERTVILWCAPSSVVRGFESLDEFAVALQQELAGRLRFDSMHFNRFELQGDAFAYQSAILLDDMLIKLDPAGIGAQGRLQAQEQAFAALSDLSQAFIEGYVANPGAEGAALPAWLENASSDDCFEYQRALLDLALDQAACEGASALAGILDLQAYTRERLREQLLEDHPDEANYFPDDLLLTLTTARGVPGGAGVGAGDGVVQRRTLTLTEFAIGNLASLQGAVLSAIDHREQQLIMDWLTPDYLRHLVETVNIGGNYPRYVAQALDDPLRPERVRRFAREWRSSLLFTALKSKVDGVLSAAAYHCVADYSRGRIDAQLPTTMLMPLAFRSEQQAGEIDPVAGMFVLYCAAPRLTLLYRPLYSERPILEFSSPDAMMAAIRESGALQQSILDWMTPGARRVYAHGGFAEPHLLRPIDDTLQSPPRPKPSSFAAQFWHIDADARLYAANRQLLIELADRESLSNAESRWSILTQGAWLLFDVASLVVRGPVASLAWMVQAIAALDKDLPALSHGEASQRFHAVLDLLLNTGMALFHLHLAQVPVAVETSTLAVGVSPVQDLPPPTQGKVFLPGALKDQPALRVDFSWRGLQGFNLLDTQQRAALRLLRRDVSLNDVQPEATGAAQGLYRVDGRYYASLAGDVYHVELGEQGARIVQAAGMPGPWLIHEHGQWRVDGGLRLRGGGPKRRADAIRQQNQDAFAALQLEEASAVRVHNTLARVYELSTQKLHDQAGQLGKLQTLRERTTSQAGGEVLLASLDEKISQAQASLEQAKEQALDDLRALIDSDTRMDNLLRQMCEPRFANQLIAPVIKQQRSTIRQELIDRSVVYYNEAVEFINKLDSAASFDNLAVRPETPQEIAQYRTLRRLLDKQVGLLAELLQVSEALDQLLPQTLRDDDIIFREQDGTRLNKEMMLSGIIERRRLNEIDLRVRRLIELGELALERLSGVDEKVLMRYQHYLCGPDLKSAGSAHAELAGYEPALADRLAVLAGVLEDYNIASAHASYLANTGGAAINAGRLQHYRQSLAALVQAAERDFAEAVREQELAQVHVPKSSLYQQRPGRRRVVQTQRGRSIIGQEVEIDGASVIQQHEAASGKVLKTFHRQGSEWVEDANADPAEEVLSPAPGDAAAAAAKARTVLAQVESVIGLAKRYIRADEPIGLSSVLEGHIDKLREARRSLASAKGSDELGAQLEENIERLQAAQRDLLTSLYLTSSHPTAASLRFLVEEQQVTVHRSVQRKALTPTDFLDVYEVRRLPQRGRSRGEGLWEAHFHYPTAATPGREFAKGHLKLWSQRSLGREAQLRAAVSGHSLLAIYRGDLRLSQVDGIIPFD